MTTGQRFGGYPAQFGYAVAQTLDVTQLMGYELDAGNTKTGIIPSGSIDRAAVLTSRMRPRFRLRTKDMATVLGLVDLQAGYCFDEDSTFQLQERADCGTFLSGSTHIQRTVKKGFMFVDSITAEQESEDGAILNLEFIPLKSGSNALVSHDTAQALLLSPAYVSSFFLGPFYHNSSEIPGVMGVTLNFGINVQPAPASPGAEDDVVSIISREPEFSVRCLKTDEFDGFKLGGTPVTSSFAFYFQKADATNAVGDGRVAVASSVHVKVSGTAGDFEVRNLSVDGQEDAAVELILRPTGTISLSVASAIP